MSRSIDDDGDDSTTGGAGGARSIPIRRFGGGGDERERGERDAAPAFRVKDRRWWASEEDDGGAGAPAEPAADKPSYVRELEDRIARLEALVDDKDRLARDYAARVRGAADEVERAKQRLRAESDKQLELRRRDVLLAFLDVLDDLDRALSSAREADHSSPVVDGVELVRKRFLAKLGEFDVTWAPSLGERFDPVRHDAVSQVPVADPAQDGVVVGVIREGYRIGDAVLRPATVAVGKASSL